MTATAPRATKTATRHYCSLNRSVHCTKGDGMPTRKACGYCGGNFVIEHGVWAVFPWRSDGQYKLADTLATYVQYGRANRFAINGGSDLVVRWISK